MFCCSTCRLRVERAKLEFNRIQLQHEEACEIIKIYKRDIMIQERELHTRFEHIEDQHWSSTDIKDLKMKLQDKYHSLVEILDCMKTASEMPGALDCLREEAKDRLDWARRIAGACDHVEPTIQTVHYGES